LSACGYSLTTVRLGIMSWSVSFFEGAQKKLAMIQQIKDPIDVEASVVRGEFAPLQLWLRRVRTLHAFIERACQFLGSLLFG
jgi:hypothetical protein